MLGSQNPLRTSTWCGLVGTNGGCTLILSTKDEFCQLNLTSGTNKLTTGTNKLTLTAIKLQDTFPQDNKGPHSGIPSTILTLVSHFCDTD